MTRDWTDNLLRAERGESCRFCLTRNSPALRDGQPGDVRSVSLGSDNGFEACRECLRIIADTLDAARPKKTRHLCPDCKGSGVVSGTLIGSSATSTASTWVRCSTCDGKRLVVVRVTGPLKVLEAVPSSPDESPVVPGQEDPA